MLTFYQAITTHTHISYTNMSRILRINSSSRQAGSHSKELADFFQETWLRQHPNDEFIVRDLAQTPIPHISDITIAGFYTPKEQHTDEIKAATALSDELIAELLSADVLLFSVPIYNFSIPSGLKAYIDQIVRAGYTFGFDPEKGFYGLVNNKRAFITAAYGASGYFDGDLRSLNFLEPYLKALLSFLGVSDVTFFSVEGTSINPSAFEITRKQAVADIESLIGGKV
jgi:FMN-dependent NADH-azoreductase